MSQSANLIFILLIVVAFYFLILRPQKKRQQALQKTIRELQPGDRVLLGSGLFGTLISVGDKQAVLEISPGVELTVLKQAIVRRATEADEDADTEAVTEDEVADELETEAVATYDTGDPQPIVRADSDAPTTTTETDRSNLR